MTKAKAKFALGERTAYSRAVLQSTSQTAGGEADMRGHILELDEMRPNRSEFHTATPANAAPRPAAASPSSNPERGVDA